MKRSREWHLAACPLFDADDDHRTICAFIRVVSFFFFFCSVPCRTAVHSPHSLRSTLCALCAISTTTTSSSIAAAIPNCCCCCCCCCCVTVETIDRHSTAAAITAGQEEGKKERKKKGTLLLLLRSLSLLAFSLCLCVRAFLLNRCSTIRRRPLKCNKKKKGNQQQQLSFKIRIAKAKEEDSLRFKRQISTAS